MCRGAAAAWRLTVGAPTTGRRAVVEGAGLGLVCLNKASLGSGRQERALQSLLAGGRRCSSAAVQHGAERSCLGGTLHGERSLESGCWSHGGSRPRLQYGQSRTDVGGGGAQRRG